MNVLLAVLCLLLLCANCTSALLHEASTKHRRTRAGGIVPEPTPLFGSGGAAKEGQPHARAGESLTHPTANPLQYNTDATSSYSIAKSHPASSVIPEYTGFGREQS